jgi:uncharacterized protein with HEPN domain
MKKNNLIYLKQIVEYVIEADGYVSGISFKEFEKSGLLQDAVIRKVELIGEAARKLSPLFWEKYRKVLPLAEAVSTRNRLIHEYDDVDLEIVWNTVKKDLPKLKEKIEEII